MNYFGNPQSGELSYMFCKIQVRAWHFCLPAELWHNHQNNIQGIAITSHKTTAVSLPLNLTVQRYILSSNLHKIPHKLQEVHRRYTLFSTLTHFSPQTFSRWFWFLPWPLILQQIWIILGNGFQSWKKCSFLFQVSGEPAVRIHIRVGSLAIKEKVDFLGKKKIQRDREKLSNTETQSLCLSLFPFLFSLFLPPFLARPIWTWVKSAIHKTVSGWISRWKEQKVGRSSQMSSYQS